MPVLRRDGRVARVIDGDRGDAGVGRRRRDGEIAVRIRVDVPDRAAAHRQQRSRIRAGADVTFDLPDRAARGSGLLLIGRRDHGAARAATSRTRTECGYQSNRKPSIASHRVIPPGSCCVRPHTIYPNGPRTTHLCGKLTVPFSQPSIATESRTPALSAALGTTPARIAARSASSAFVRTAMR